MNNTAQKLGFYAASTAFIFTAAYSMVQLMQVVKLISFPWDAILIYSFSFGIAIPFLLAMLALHFSVPPQKQIWSAAAILFAIMYAVYVNLNYIVQLAIVIPAAINGSYDEIKLLDQTPHSLFWNIDALGYINLGLATLFAAPVFNRQGIQKWTRIFFLANAFMTPVIAVVYFYPTFSIGLLMLGAPWIITATGSMLFLALYFKNANVQNVTPLIKSQKKIIQSQKNELLN
jgi:hypothetical protein